VKVSFIDKRVVRDFLEKVSILSTILTLTLIFVEIPACWKITAGGLFLLGLGLLYFCLWYRANGLQTVQLNIEGSTVVIRTGDIFEQPGFKAIAFNEYFDTQVDDRIISSNSLNGIFLKEHLPISLDEFDDLINTYKFEQDDVLEANVEREGKSTRYRLGTVFVCDEYIATAFSKFDSHNRAVLTMPQYLEFLISFWDNVNRVYSQKSVSVTIFGSGITRIKEHKNISDEDLLKIMLWTFRISEMRFKFPAKLTIVVHKDKIDSINLLDIKSAENGL